MSYSRGSTRWRLKGQKSEPTSYIPEAIATVLEKRLPHDELWVSQFIESYGLDAQKTEYEFYRGKLKIAKSQGTTPDGEPQTGYPITGITVIGGVTYNWPTW